MAARLNHDDYTIAWIAVLPIEAEAALGMLDKQHDGQFESVRGDDIASKIILGLSTIFTVVSIFMIAIDCNVSHPWIFMTTHCTAAWPRWEAFAAFDIFTEVLLVLMPLFIVQALQMSWGKKFIVQVAFSLRLLILVPIAFRLFYLKKEYFSSNPTLEGTWAAICTQVDIAFAIFSATIPCIRPFMAATATIPAPTDGTRKGSRYAGGSREKSGSGRRASNSYGLTSLTGKFTRTKKSCERQSSTSTDEIFGRNGDHTVSVVSPGDQHSVESQDSRQMIIRRDVEWAVTDEENKDGPKRSYSQHGHESVRDDEGTVGDAV